MTGRDLIICILQNNFENTDVTIFMSEFFVSKEAIAKKFNVGTATIDAWHNLNLIKGISIDGKLYFPITTKDPRKD